MISDERLKELIKFTASMMFVKLYDGQAERYPYPEYKLALSELLDARRKIDMLKEDAERLAVIAMKFAMPDLTYGEAKTLRRKLDKIIDEHKQVMRKVDPPTLSSFIGCMKEVK